MKFAFDLARHNLRGHKWRSILSSLGLFVCVFFIVAVITISASLSAYLSSRLKGMEQSLIIISGASSGSALDFIELPSATLNANDLTAARDTVGADNVAANQFFTATARLDKEKFAATIVGTTATEETAFNATLAGGSWMNDSHSDNKNYVVLGYDAARSLIGTDEPLNQVIDIRGHSYTVVGTLRRSPQPLSLAGVDLNRAIFMSDTNSQKLNSNSSYNQILVRGLSLASREKLRQKISLNHTESSEYNFITADKLGRKVQDLTRDILRLTAVVVILILIISAVSIASTMLVSVTERRREIGIRKSVGATPRAIVAQYMAETLLITLRAGISATALAYLTVAIIALFWHLPLTFSPLALVIGLGCPVAIALIAGVYPAHKAAHQNIISALNQLT